MKLRRCLGMFDLALAVHSILAKARNRNNPYYCCIRLILFSDCHNNGQSWFWPTIEGIGIFGRHILIYICYNRAITACIYKYRLYYSAGYDIDLYLLSI